MARPNLPINIDTTYGDSAADASIRAHQLHHDAIHAVVNDFDMQNAVTAGYVPIGNGSALITRTLTATDVTSTVNVVNVRDFGAVGNGSSDDTSAIAAAAAALTPGSRLFFPAGTYATSATVSITVPCYIEGAGGGFTTSNPQTDVGVVLVNRTSGAGIFRVSSDAVHFRRLFFTSYGGPAAAIASKATAITFERGDYCSVAECVFTGWYKWLWFRNCASWVVRDNHFQLAAKYGIHVQNGAAPDNGDQILTNNMLASNAPWNTEVLVRQESGGGLKAIGNKFLCPGVPGAKWAFELAIADGANTSILIVSANSFENFSTGSIRITHAGPYFTGTFVKVNVTGNQFTGGQSTGPIIDIRGRSPGVGLGDILISANMFDGNGSKPASFITVNNAARVSIAANTFYNAPVGVVVGAAATTTAVPASNSYYAVPIHVSGIVYNAG